MNKKNIIYKNIEALQPIVNIINEAASAINDKTRTISKSSIPEVLTGVLGAGIGGVFSFTALYGLGTVGFSAAGITSGLATAGGIIGGGMVAGIFVLATPIALLAATGVGVASHIKGKQLKQEKEKLYQEALKKHQAIIMSLKEETDASKKRLDYLQSLNIILTKVIEDLRKDLNIKSEKNI